MYSATVMKVATAKRQSNSRHRITQTRPISTLFEIGLVCVILWRLFDWRFAVATFITVALYIAYTLMITEWRTKYRRQMNEVDSEANTKAIDSLLNYETVKYFGNEEHEAARFDNALKRYERAA